MAAESRLLSDIRLALGRVPGLALFRNNTGTGWVGEVVKRTGDMIVLRNPRPLHAGLCTGSSDLVGWRSVEITPDMVGKRVAVFVAVECKAPKGRTKSDQLAFIDAINNAGGMAGVAKSVGDAEVIVSQRSCF